MDILQKILEQKRLIISLSGINLIENWNIFVKWIPFLFFDFYKKTAEKRRVLA